MPSLHDQTTLTRLQERLSRLKPESCPRWGTMNSLEMLNHLRRSIEISLGDSPQRCKKPKLLSVLFRALIIVPVPFPRNVKTGRDFLGSPEGEFARALEQLQEYLPGAAKELATTTALVVHPIFGAMSGAMWSRLAAKHTDHHLRQFGL